MKLYILKGIVYHKIVNLHQTEEKRAELDAKWERISEQLKILN